MCEELYDADWHHPCDNVKGKLHGYASAAPRNSMQTSLRRSSFQNRKDQEREGLVVWNHKGVVVVWPDGHRSRFSWAVLRQACPCPECRKQRAEQAITSKDESASR